MNQALTFMEKLIIGVVVLFAAAFVGIFSLVNKAGTPTSKNIEGMHINYKMARPESPYAEYTLEGRELDQLYEGLPEDQVAALKKEHATPAKIAEAKKKEAAKKAEVKKQETKKAQQVAQAKKAVQQRQQAAQKRAQQQASDKTSASNNSYDNSAAAFVAPAQQDNTPAPTQPVATNKKSFTEWRSQIFANPTSDILNQFIAAYRKGEVTATEYQAMAQDLLEQTDTKYQALGLQALRSVPSLASLSQMVHAEATLPATYQAYVEQAYLAYFYPQNLSYFSAALSSQDRTLKTKVLSLLSTNLTKLSHGDQTVFVNSRNQRAASDVNFTLSSFNSLLPSLNTLIQSGDAELASSAQQIAALIDTVNNVAQN